MENGNKIIQLFDRFQRSKPTFYIKGHKLRHFDMVVMYYLSVRKSISVTDFAGILDMKKSAFSKALKSVEEKGLVERTTSVDDRRKVYVTLTDLGEQFCSDTNSCLNKKFKEFKEKMGEDFPEFIRLFEKAITILEDENV